MKVRAIAVNTFREALRDKVLYSLVFFAFVMIFTSVILDHITVGEQTKIIKDFGLAAISLFGVLVAIFVGIGLVYKEIERKTIYNILSKPVHRYQFIVGKYIGLVMTLGIVTGLMSLLFFLLLYCYEGRVDIVLLPAIGMIMLELMLVTAIALLFSSFSTPILSGLFTLSFYIIGHLTQDLLALGKRFSGTSLEYGATALYYLIPNLEYFNLKGTVVYHIHQTPQYYLFTVGYGLLYCLIIILLSVAIFQNRDFR
ncbi:MAG TPA: ABC transporter permease [Thermodesulfobacteriota bacterium]|nr:ABC transporter permease [Deltaproteobacteria bacterium]HNR13518.1 ABC transporter permease [Thermodesulfobacteriota bacterium]HNU70325.1 ABC transporter permease [Thermodesulfobacteriota bacterium]HQO77525.1 ABC transporter permease [Thermodesulfobacteriota bacterium]